MADWYYEPHRIEEWVSDIIEKANKRYFIWMDGSYKENKNGTYTFKVFKRREEKCPTCKHVEEKTDNVGTLVLRETAKYSYEWLVIKSTVPGITVSTKHVKAYEVQYG